MSSTFESLRLHEPSLVQAGRWKEALRLYREKGMWDDCLRIAKTHGGRHAFTTVMYAYFLQQNASLGIQMMVREGLGPDAVEFALSRCEFDEAICITQGTCPYLLLDTYFKVATSLEDDGSFGLAEKAFIKAEKPREAIDMYVHVKLWTAALGVAERFAPDLIARIKEAEEVHNRSIFWAEADATSQDMKPVSHIDISVHICRHADNMYQGRSLALQVLPHETVASVKLKIRTKTCHEQDLVLMLAGNELHDKLTVAQCQVGHGAVLNLVVSSQPPQTQGIDSSIVDEMDQLASILKMSSLG
jgi:hypothetical protein